MNLLPLQHIILCQFFLATVSSSGVLIKSGVVKNHGETQSENAEDVKLHKGIANYEGEAGFNKDEGQKAIISEDSGKFDEHSGKKKIHEGSDNFQKENFHQTGGDSAGNLDTRVATKKGHHKSGFSNSYHKDESGSNTSFYDDGSDEAAQIHQKNYKDAYGDNGFIQQGGGKYDSAHFANDEARRGLYDNSGRYEKDHGNNRKYNRNNYYDNKENLARRNLANAYDRGSNYAEEQYGPAYYPPPLPYGPLPPLPPKHHITIYEDPRYLDSDVRYRRSDGYGDDYVELDVRSPVERNPHVRYYEEPDYLYYD
ncbi:hypothetical protein ABEB36_004272 [Hypothenemus hampei]|uniref:Uncharacterized protein n=1 Tax=Hypothenemus hampei TaxID=57062 RepID=A0ABD1F2S7_HYPHA